MARQRSVWSYAKNDGPTPLWATDGIQQQIIATREESIFKSSISTILLYAGRKDGCSWLPGSHAAVCDMGEKDVRLG